MARTVEVCAGLLEVIAPGFAADEPAALEEIAVGTAWIDEAEPLVSQRVLEAAGRFPRARPLEWPKPHIAALFMQEVANVHRELYAENGELYGEEIAVKIERCLAVSDAEAKRAEQARAEYRERCAELMEGIDLLLTPTLQCVAPPTGIGDLALRDRLIANTLPFNALGWPALALPCGDAEDGLPASVQLVGRPGADRLVLAAGARLASLIRGTAERGRLPTTT
jgi:aspartyl-tRNA(Asn)/glutamyl-tRNA(Gln) amidotransferase subunit A